MHTVSAKASTATATTTTAYDAGAATPICCCISCLLLLLRFLCSSTHAIRFRQQLFQLLGTQLLQHTQHMW
jgi:hypothetical protein